MNDEQYKNFIEKFFASNSEAIKIAIEKNVNGHIRDMSKKLDEHAAQDLEYQKKIDGNISWIVKLFITGVVAGVIGMLFK